MLIILTLLSLMSVACSTQNSELKQNIISEIDLVQTSISQKDYVNVVS